MTAAVAPAVTSVTPALFSRGLRRRRGSGRRRRRRRRGRRRERAAARRAVGADDHELHATVGRASPRGAALLDGAVRTEAVRLEARLGDAVLGEVVPHREGAAVRQVEVVRRVAAVVGVALHVDAQVRHRPEDRADGVEHLEAPAADDLVAVRAEVHGLEDADAVAFGLGEGLAVGAAVLVLHAVEGLGLRRAGVRAFGGVDDAVVVGVGRRAAAAHGARVGPGGLLRALVLVVEDTVMIAVDARAAAAVRVRRRPGRVVGTLVVVVEHAVGVAVREGAAAAVRVGVRAGRLVHAEVVGVVHAVAVGVGERAAAAGRVGVRAGGGVDAHVLGVDDAVAVGVTRRHGLVRRNAQREREARAPEHRVGRVVAGDRDAVRVGAVLEHHAEAAHGADAEPARGLELEAEARVEGRALVAAGEGPAAVHVDEEPAHRADAGLDADAAHGRQHAARAAGRNDAGVHREPPVRQAHLDHQRVDDGEAEAHRRLDRGPVPEVVLLVAGDHRPAPGLTSQREARQHLRVGGRRRTDHRRHDGHCTGRERRLPCNRGRSSAHPETLVCDDPSRSLGLPPDRLSLFAASSRWTHAPDDRPTLQSPRSVQGFVGEGHRNQRISAPRGRCVRPSGTLGFTRTFTDPGAGSSTPASLTRRVATCQTPGGPWSDE